MNLKGHAYFSKFALPLLLLYVMVYEWRVVLEAGSLLPALYSLKFLIPLYLSVFVLNEKWKLNSPPARLYGFFFSCFMLWGLFSCLFSSAWRESLTQWFKFVPLVLFYQAAAAYLAGSETARRRVIIFTVCVSVISVAQYLLMQASISLGHASLFKLATDRGVDLRGPFGILGQAKGVLELYHRTVLVYRLYGFWPEPSAASGFLLAASFFSEAYYAETKQKKWRIASVICLAGGGLATFSNAGYLAVGLTGLLGEIFWIKRKKHKLRHCFTALFFLALSWTAIFGRYYAVKYFPSNTDLSFIIGVRNTAGDPYGGRIQLVTANVHHVLSGNDAAGPEKSGRIDIMKILAGIGFRIPGNGVTSGVAVSASAPVLWFVFTGMGGIILLMLRELQLVKAIAAHFFSSVYILRFSQAWLAMFIIHASYGTWMTPMYLLTAAMVFASVSEYAGPEPQGTASSGGTAA